MKEVNNYLYQIFTLMQQCQGKGLLQRPKRLRVCYRDKKVLKTIYNVYHLYKHKIPFSEFINMSVNYTISTGDNLIKSGQFVAELIEKTTKK